MMIENKTFYSQMIAAKAFVMNLITSSKMHMDDHGSRNTWIEKASP